MTTARLLLLLLLIVVAVVIVVVVLRRGSAQRDRQRAEAAGLRSEADTIAATMSGQSTFADQAAERAEVARVEAERTAREAEEQAREAERQAREAQERAREAERLEAEAAQHRAAVETTQREYESTMRRADDIDPDVKESQFAPGETGHESVDEAAAGVEEPAPASDGSADAAPSPAAVAAPSPADDAAPSPADDAAPVTGADASSEGEGEAAEPMTRAERRAARLAAEQSGGADVPEPAGGDVDPTASTGWAAPAAASAAPAAGAVGAAAAGAAAWGTPDEEPASRESERIASAADYRDDVAGENPDVSGGPAAGSDGGMSDQTRADSAPADDTAPAADTTPRGDIDTDLSHDVESPRGEWGGPPRDDAADEVTIVADPEAYAATEPVMASEQSARVTPEPAGDTATAATRSADDSRADDNTPGADLVDADHVPAETGAAVAEPDATDRSAADQAAQPHADRFDTTPTRDWAADEGELLDENHDRGERLEAERAELAEQAPVQHVGRRISAFEEIRDGGFGVGSAAPLDDGAQPLDHPVAGFHDMTYRAPGDPGYDDARPDVWFYDEGAAQRSGFRRAEG